MLSYTVMLISLHEQKDTDLQQATQKYMHEELYKSTTVEPCYDAYTCNNCLKLKAMSRILTLHCSTFC